MNGTEDQLEILLLGADATVGLAPLLSAFAAAPAISPTFVRMGKRREALSEKACAKALAAGKLGETTFLFLGRDSSPTAEYHFTFVPDEPIGVRLLAKIPLAVFAKGRGESPLAVAVVTLLRELSRATTPVYGYAHSLADRLLGDDPNAGDPDADKNVYEVYWANVYGSPMVDRIGRQRLERLSDVSGVTLEWLPGGGCLFTTRPGPADFASDAARQSQAATLAHLRPDVDGAVKLRELRRRSHDLAPVEAAFDADVAELLERTLELVDIAHRPAEVARLNAYHPPPVSERRQARGLLSDVADTDTEIERYRDRYAEQLAALLHRHVPDILEGDPAVLPAVDFHFWQSDYPRLFERTNIDTDLVPAVGAFIGEMLVRHLGGYWVPRRNLDEASVVIGDWAWLPFLRARHYLENRDGALDYSLTQFYRVASRSGSR
jgi:hypothetical protein